MKEISLEEVDKQANAYWQEYLDHMYQLAQAVFWRSIEKVLRDNRWTLNNKTMDFVILDQSGRVWNADFDENTPEARMVAYLNTPVPGTKLKLGDLMADPIA